MARINYIERFEKGRKLVNMETYDSVFIDGLQNRITAMRRENGLVFIESGPGNAETTMLQVRRSVCIDPNA